MLKPVGIHMTVERFPVGATLFEDEALPAAALLLPLADEEGEQASVEHLEMFCEGRLRLTESEYSVSYEETELTGMDGSTSQLSFQRAEPTLLTMLRGGAVSTALVFEPNKRHICIYKTPFMTLEACVHTLKVDNRLLKDEKGGTVELDYVVEIRGAQAERCRMKLEVYERS